MSERETAYQYLLKLLSVRPRTEKEARSRLRGKGFSEDVVEETIARAKEEGLLDDALFARLYAEDRATRRPRSKRLIARELVRKGIPPELVRKALEKALGDRDEVALARSALEKRLPLLRGLPREVALRRAYGYLLRRGFSHQVSREVVGKLLGGAGTGLEGEEWT